MQILPKFNPQNVRNAKGQADEQGEADGIFATVDFGILKDVGDGASDDDETDRQGQQHLWEETLKKNLLNFAFLKQCGFSPQSNDFIFPPAVESVKVQTRGEIKGIGGECVKWIDLSYWFVGFSPHF